MVMAVLEALTGPLRTCGNLTLQPPGRLGDLCGVLKAVLQKKVSGGGVRPQKAALSSAHPATTVERTQGSPSSAEYVFHRQPVRTLMRTMTRMMTR